MRRSIFAIPLAVLALLPAAGCGNSAPPAKPTDDEIRELRAKNGSGQPGQPDALASGAPLFQLPTLGYRDWTVKETAVDALARIGASAVPVLTEALSDPNAEVRVQAARSLARMGDAGKAAIPTLIERLNDPDEDVRQASARALGQMGPAAADAAPALIAIIKTPDAETGKRNRTPSAPINRP